MVSVRDHYERFLARHYSWMFGDYEARVQRELDFFASHSIAPVLGGLAVDLGCGSGFQSLALADLGFRVLAIDLSANLLAELNGRRGDRDIRVVQGDMLDFPLYLSGARAEVIACMGDALTHLGSFSQVANLLGKTYESLEPGGMLVLSFRDLTVRLEGADRIIPVHSDENAILTTFLEYDDYHVNVFDVLYTRTDAGWHLEKSGYRKLRLGADRVVGQLRELGFKVLHQGLEEGLVRIVAAR